jgi:hypothetical protein
MIKWLHEFQDVGEQKIHKTLVKKEFTTVQRGVALCAAFFEFPTSGQAVRSTLFLVIIPFLGRLTSSSSYSRYIR